ncbi:bifunctional uridylyltransferase/uridylyl-removing enzyme [Catellatospora methionotrophica]|uniref:Bifunctional uridylyltransferase/uridylyl-removing enzyme n=1 Tax=Catellatospora methionotrophica TaxID=121620 RepID=A0A8J3LGE8_9ACTN|nr:[protein-PII] uridylyltransferase [Catellatospora methionotrophica]GIG17863.1 bifunctional uridylyltransferase/uridylyl-removing enzyme [Catellatospora methionotrophica]
MGPGNVVTSASEGAAGPGPDYARLAQRDQASIGADARLARAGVLDGWLRRLLPDTPGVALVAVGGLGRRECTPHGDLDLILVHAGVPRVDELAASLWYPIWDARMGLDHSTRTVAESLDAAHDDVKVALGLLDARHIAGDPALSAQLSRAAVDQWRRTARRQLLRLRELVEERHAAHGELAYLLEGDVKEAAGGLRDVGVLRGIGVAGVADALPPQVRAAATRLLDVRDALHVSIGRRNDRLRAQERLQVAELLGLADGDALLRRIGLDARAVSWSLTDAWRSVQRWTAAGARHGEPRPREAVAVRRPIARDVVAADGEIVLARAAVGPHPDPSLSLRVAAAAAQHQMPIARATLEWLARFCPPLPTPWPASARSALLTLLGAGTGLVAAWEACDRFGLTSTWLPQWTRLRGTPQHHPVHRFTLDRHLVQAAANAATWSREVARPDLLVLGALLHDVGKGLPGDHSEVGAELAREIATAIGLPTADVDTIAALVRYHLVLPDTATRRDLDDPATINYVAKLVGDTGTLDLLQMLARSDAQATGPAAWSGWKSKLIDDLCARVRKVLGGGQLPEPTPPDPALLAGPLPVVQVADDWVALAAHDRVGLLAAVAGCLATHKLEIVAAGTSTIGERAIIECAVNNRYGAPPDRELLAADLRRVGLDQLPLPRRLGGAGGRKPVTGAEPRVIWGEATGATLLELRATDSPGLLYRVTSALAALGVDVRTARVSTLGADVVDAFYLVGDVDRDAAEAAVLAAA